MKHSQIYGILAVALLIGSCFFPWAYYPDLDKTFNGFFSAQNQYGKPGKFFLFFGFFAVIFFLIPKVWAKRWNLLVGALTVAYALRTFIVFSGCYNIYCPEKKAGIWVMLASSIIIMVMTFLPDIKIDSRKK